MLTHFSFKNSHSVSRLGRTAAVLTFVVLILVGVPICDAQQAPGNYVGPKLLSSEQPEYVGEAKDAGVEGTVTVHVKIDDAGNVIIADDPHGLGRACGIVDFQPILKLYQSVIDSVKKSKFEPATRDGRPVESEIWINSTFKLSDDPAAANAPLPPNVSKKKAKDPFEKRLKSMPKPEYPKAALAVRAVGSVPVRVVVDDYGKVVLAQATGGHPLLRSAAEDAACKASFEPLVINGKPSGSTGTLSYRFVF